MILVKTCCGCVSLEKGTIVIGTLSLIIGIVNMVVMGLHLSAIHEPTNEPLIGVSLIALKMFIVSTLIYCILSIIVSVLLIAGAAKRRSSHIFPWLAISFGSIVSTFCAAVGFSLIAAIECPVTELLLILLFFSVAVAVPMYFWRVVYSYYKELVAEKFGHQSPPKDGKIMFSPPYQNV